MLCAALVVLVCGWVLMVFWCVLWYNGFREVMVC